VSGVCLYVAYIELNSRTERPGKSKISTEVANVTCDSNISVKVKVKRSKCNLQGPGHIATASHSVCLSRMGDATGVGDNAPTFGTSQRGTGGVPYRGAVQ